MPKQRSKVAAPAASAAGGPVESTPAGNPAESTPAGPPSTSTHDEIASLAYALWHARGCPDGSSEEDWFRAEHQLRSEAKHGTDTVDAALSEPQPVRSLSAGRS